MYQHHYTIQLAEGPHQVSWVDVLAQASPGSGRAVVHRTSLAIWLPWQGPPLDQGIHIHLPSEARASASPAWSILDIRRAWINLEAQPGKDSLQCVPGTI